MQAIVKIESPKTTKNLTCSCEKLNLKISRKKNFVCEICSEKKFLRQNSEPMCIDCDNSLD